MSETATSTPFPLAAPFFEGDERSNRERMLAGDWYVADDPDNKRIAAHARKTLHRFETALFSINKKMNEKYKEIRNTKNERLR